MINFYVIALIIGFIVLIVGLAFLIQGASYVTSDDDTTKGMADLAKRYAPGKVLDIGSGNGKLVISIASHGIHAVGIELNPLLVLISRRTIKKAGLQGRAKIIWGSYWSHDFSQYDMLTVYTVPHVMKRLEIKFSKELKKGTVILSNFAKIPDKKAAKRLGKINVYNF